MRPLGIGHWFVAGADIVVYVALADEEVEVSVVVVIEKIRTEGEIVEADLTDAGGKADPGPRPSDSN